MLKDISFQIAITKKLSSSDQKDHWLDHAKGKYGEKQVEDTKLLLRVLVLLVPVPVFWALFEQIVS